MKNVLNTVSAILIILFLGWQFCGDCCEKKCDYSKCEKSGATKCKGYETKEGCPHADEPESIITEGENTENNEIFDGETFEDLLEDLLEDTTLQIR